jgi:TPR repeat protein
MHMLAVMYYNGLNLPKDREKGLYWYRKAAAQGSDAARAELSAIEGGR